MNLKIRRINQAKSPSPLSSDSKLLQIAARCPTPPCSPPCRRLLLWPAAAPAAAVVASSSASSSSSCCQRQLQQQQLRQLCQQLLRRRASPPRRQPAARLPARCRLRDPDGGRNWGKEREIQRIWEREGLNLVDSRRRSPPGKVGGKNWGEEGRCIEK